VHIAPPGPGQNPAKGGEIAMNIPMAWRESYRSGSGGSGVFKKTHDTVPAGSPPARAGDPGGK